MPRNVQRFGDAALWFATRSAAQASALAAAIRAARIDGVTDVVGGARSVLVIYEPTMVEFGGLRETVGSITATPLAPGGRTLIFDTAFDGQDLDEVGAVTGLGADGVRRALLGATLRVSFLGFAPGFAYLTGLPAPLRALPRRAAPRSSVPAGSLAIGGGHAAVYPRATPGGWHIVGRTDVELFDSERPPHALLEPGDVVRLREVDPSDVVAPVRRSATGPRGVLGRGTFVVESAGLYTTFQDVGRAGLAHLGVPRAGAADPVTFRLANTLVGNPAGAACLEVTGTGPSLVCRADTHVAVVGSGVEVTLDGWAVGCGRVLPVAPGQRLRIGSTGRSLRAYLAVRGGFEAPVVLGSRSTDRLGGLGPDPLAVGDELGAGPPPGAMSDHLLPGSPGLEPPSLPRRLRALVTAETNARWRRELFERRFEVGETIDRVGLRLRSLDGSPIPTESTELPSAGTLVGAVQVPPGGQPLVLLADHATVGGYPVGAVVISADVAELGRCRPGDTVELVAVDHDQALDALRVLHRAVETAAVGSYPIGAG